MKVNPKDHVAYWKAIRGAVKDAMNAHPDYLTEKGRKNMVDSVSKRVLGSIVSVKFPGKGE